MLDATPTRGCQRLLAVLSLGLCLAAAGAFAQSETGLELQLQQEITDDYEVYLDEQELRMRASLAAGGSDEESARMALVVILFAQLQVETDRANERIAESRSDISTDTGDLYNLFADEIAEEDLRSAQDVVDAVQERIDNGIDDELRQDVEDISGNPDLSGDEVTSALEDFNHELADRTEEIEQLLVELRDTEEPFSVTVHFSRDGTEEVVELTREDLDAVDGGEPSGFTDLFGLDTTQGENLDSVVDDLSDATTNLNEALVLLRESNSADDNMETIDTIRLAFANFDSALVDLEDAFGDGPLALGLSVDEISAFVADTDGIFGGETFQVGDMVVRPAALLENRTDEAHFSQNLLSLAAILGGAAQVEFQRADDFEREGKTTRAEKARLRGWMWVLLAASGAGLSDPPETLMLEFYSKDDPASHTFRGFFPLGLSAAMMELIGVDMIVNARASQQEFEDYLRQLRSRFQQRSQPDPTDSEARAGLAIIRTYFLLSENRSQFTDLVNLAAEGDIEGFVEEFDESDFDFAASADSTEEDVDIAVEDEDLIFLLLSKLDDDGALFVIEEDDAIVPIPVTGGQLTVGLERVRAVSRSSAEVSTTLREARDDVDTSFELDLDPNELDFSDSDSRLDFAEALERSNERFLQLTPEGHQDLVDAGDELETQLVDLSTAVSDLRDFIEDLEEDNDADLAGVSNTVVDFDDFYQEVTADFETEPETTAINGRDVDLSAWFNNPPDSLLQRFIWYLDDDENTDNTLGGLLPEIGGDESVILETLVDPLPQAFGLSQNRPNPFNGSTLIEFQLAAGRGPVELVLYNTIGGKVATLVSGVREGGVYHVVWDGRDEAGRTLASGLYLYRLEAGGQTLTQRLLLIR